jgi:hypothetical protein
MSPPGKQIFPLNYRIHLQGHLDHRWSDWFSGFKIEHTEGDTILIGVVADQSALHGILAKIRDLGLPILLVENLDNREL